LGNPNKYLIISPLQNMAEFDQPAPMLKVLGQGGIAALMAKMQKIVQSTRMCSLEAQPALGFAPKQGYTLKMGVLATNVVAPGREVEFERNTKTLLEAVRKTNAKGFLTAKIGLGGNPNEYLTFVPFDSFADLEQFGPAIAKAMVGVPFANEAGVVLQRDYEVIRLIPELSIQPPAKAAAR
jgi:hypothetical protein